MAEKVEITKTVYNNQRFKQIVDTEFNFFKEPDPVQDLDTVEELFRLYEKLFNTIPTTGPNSHQYIVTKSSEIYTTSTINEEIQPLLDEVADLRERLLQANEQILSLTQQINNG